MYAKTAVLEMVNANQGVRWLGYVPDDELSAIYSGSIALVSASLMEGFELIILEAMSCGTPTRLNDIPPYREVSGGHALFFDPLDIDSIANCLEKAASDHNCLESISGCGLDWVQHFSYQQCAKLCLIFLVAFQAISHPCP